MREKNEKNRDENEGRERIKDLFISFYSQEYKRFFFLSISLLLGTKRITHKSIQKKISAFGNKKDHTQGHQMIFLLFGLRTKRITLKSIKMFFFSLVWEQKGSHSRASILFSPRLETKSIIHKSIKRYLFSPVWEQKRSQIGRAHV